jgi:ribosomal protein S18 acetylase RimI-like enzyme
LPRAHDDSMPRTNDLARVKPALDRDRAWAAYAIGDLSPTLAGHCAWHLPAAGSEALLLIYRGFRPSIAFATGSRADLAPLFAEVDEYAISLHVQQAGLDAMAPSYRPTDLQPMWRMALAPSAFAPAPTRTVVALDEADLAAVSALYENGHRHGDGPTHFHPSMLGQKSFRAVLEGSDVIAVAGTHLYSPELGVCTIGNVYTRRDRRRRGLAAQVTSAVIEQAIADGIDTIVLNVSQDNYGARRVYEQLGFRIHCEFFEGEATRAGKAGGASRAGAVDAEV